MPELNVKLFSIQQVMSTYLLLYRSSLLWSESRSGWEAVASPSFTCCEKTVSECCEDDAVKLEDKAGGMVGGKPVPIWIYFGILAGTVGWTLPFTMLFDLRRLVDDPPKFGTDEKLTFVCWLFKSPFGLLWLKWSDKNYKIY